MSEQPRQPGERNREDATASRRQFLHKAVRRTAYTTPAVLTLAASPARAGSEFDSTCGDEGSPCTVNDDCCSGMCTDPGTGMKACTT